LWQIREDGDVKLPWWVDAISINQVDIPEKTEQVRMMTKIYAEAYSVRAWLGQAMEHDESGFALIRKIHGSLGYITADTQRTFVEGLAQPVRQDSLDSLGLPSQEDPHWKALLDIIYRQYFYRIWIVQELVVAQRCDVRSGSFSIDLEAVLSIGPLVEIYAAFKDAFVKHIVPEGSIQASEANRVDPVEFRQRVATQVIPAWDSSPFNTISIRDLWLFSRMRIGGGKWDSERFLLSTLLSKAGQFGASDDRDIVFAMIGLSSDISTEIIDYSQDLDTILIKVAKGLIEIGGTWGPYLFTNVNPVGRSQNLPSWVPDWANGPVRNASMDSYHFYVKSPVGRKMWTIDTANVSVAVTYTRVVFLTNDLGHTSQSQGIRNH
jgi:hypothetical protein